MEGANPLVPRFSLVRIGNHPVTHSTKLLYRQFSRFAYSGPSGITENAIKTYLYKLTANHSSWSWTASNITVLRTVFDKIGSLNLANTLSIPHLTSCLMTRRRRQ
ncbi:MAG: hypothetical protein C0404_10420 [Verrucomicrobia bacterium]|nr:hypothetical protein [Verrucomicrobiota bacterium]